MIAAAEHEQTIEPTARIFISYSRKDMGFADLLEAALKARGFETFIDREEIYAFEDWWRRLEELIAKSDTVVFVLSPDSVASSEAVKEVEYAATLNKRFAPIVCRLVDDATVPEALRRLNFIFCEDSARLEAAFDELAEALQTDIGWIRRHTEFAEATHRWVGAGRPSGLLLRPPLLEQAEYWIEYRPHGAPPPTTETQTFIAESRRAEVEWRKAEVTAIARRRRMRAAIYVMLVGIIVGLVGWINQDYVKEQWRWYSVARPFMVSQVRPYVLTATAERALRPTNSFRECAADPGIDHCPEMIVVPPGTFMMGSSPSEQASAQRRDSSPLLNPSTQTPQHLVTILKPFAVSKYPVTFDEWDTCAAYGDCVSVISDSGFGREQRPVINVTWDEAQRYVVWLSRMTGRRYRLLTEAEYEYAARGGTQTAYPWGTEIGNGNANCYDCGSRWDRKQTAPVGSFTANGYGLYDMVGNAWQWVEDCYHPNYEGAPSDGSSWTAKCPDPHRYVIRGGSYLTTSYFLHSAFRFPGTTVLSNYGPGFRVARTLTH